MPGLAIILGVPEQPDLARSLAAMLAPLTYPGCATAQLVLPELGIAIGHTGPARVATPQPGYAQAGQIAALVEGEPLDIGAVGKRLGLPPSANRADVVAALFAAEGAAGLAALTGHWAAAIVDRVHRRVVIADDAFGLRPLYRLRASNDTWLIATHPGALLAHPAASRGVNLAGMADFLAFGHVLGRKTLFQGIERLPGAAQLTWTGGSLVEQRYWKPELHPAPRAAEADLEAIRETFDGSVTSMMAAGQPFSLALTGGGDSRAILSTMMLAGVRPDTVIHTIAGATDAVLAEDIAGRSGAPFHFYEVDGRDIVAQVLPGIRLLGGQMAGIDVHPLCFLDDFPRFSHAMFTGMGGNLYKGNDFFVEGDARLDTLVAQQAWILRRYNYLITVENDFPTLFAPESCAELRDQPARSIAEALEAIGPGTPMRDRSIIFYLEERVCKYLSKGDAIVRRELETRHPFMSRRMLEQVWRVPAADRNRGYVESYIITRNMPALTKAPFTWEYGDGMPLRRYPRNRLERLETSFSQDWQIFRERRGHHPVRVPNYRWAEWVRGPLRPLFEQVLLDPRTAGRGYFRPGTIQRWFDEHVSGQDRTSKLATLLSLELTLRTFVDSPGAGA